MLAIICLVLSVLWIAAAIWIFFKEDDVYVLTFIIIFVVLGLNIMAFVSHISDLTTIKYQAELVQVREDAISRINADLKELPQTTALMNADSPARSMIETKSEYIKELTEIKSKILNAKISIERRKMGPSAWVVWILGEEVKP